MNAESVKYHSDAKMELKKIDLTTPVKEEALRGCFQLLRPSFVSTSDILDEDGRAIWLQQFISALLETAAMPSLKSLHRVAACNVLCGSIEQCIESKNRVIKLAVCSKSNCDALVDIYLDKYDGAKAKSMQQVLITSIKLLDQTMKIFSSSEPLDDIVIRQLDILFCSLDHVKAKPALHGLTLFLSRRLLTHNELLRLFHLLRGGRISAGDNESLLVAFLEGIFYWTSHQNVAPILSTFLSNFLAGTMASDTPQPAEADRMCQDPSWVAPLIQSFERSPESIQAFKNHIFPNLFRSNLSHYWRFLQVLRVEQSLGIYGQPLEREAKYRLTEINRDTLLFSALETGKELGIIQEEDTGDIVTVKVPSDRIYISDVLLTRLLLRSSEIVRLAGLTLLLSSPTFTRPFTTKTMDSILRHLPHMMADYDSNFRGRLHSLLKLLVDRTRSITCNLSKKGLEAMKRGKGQYGQAGPPQPLSDQVGRLLKCHRNMITNLAELFLSRLSTTASYQSHVSALRGIIILMRSGLDNGVHEKYWSKQAKGDIAWPFRTTILNARDVRMLLDLLFDPFDDVRQAALMILRMYDSAGTPEARLSLLKNDAELKLRHDLHFIRPTLQLSALPNLGVVLERAYNMMLESGRIDHADGIGRLFDLITARSVEFAAATGATSTPVCSGIAVGLVGVIEDAVSIAQENLSLAVSKKPMHGLLISLRYILESCSGELRACAGESINILKSLLAQIYDILLNIWQCVKPLLCNDAPEGYIPSAMEDQADVTTRDVLSYAWRALKESSLLLRTTASLLADAVTLDYNHALSLRTLGDLCFLQLSELRHRGAFSTVSQSFAYICERCSLSKRVEDKRLLLEWYERTLVLISTKGTVTTRRSAGIPALVVGIVSADKQDNLFDRAIHDLIRLAQIIPEVTDTGAIDLPQVHSFNTLKLIFTSPKLAESSEQHIVQLLTVAATNINSSIWAIRNCSLMLFRSLIDRLLGSHESMDDTNQPTLETNSRLSYENYPGLIDLFVAVLQNIGQPRILDSPHKKQEIDSHLVVPTETVFPVLDLLRRAAPPESSRERIQDLVLAASFIDHWLVRDMAARTFASLVPQSGLQSSISSCLDSKSTQANEVHGRLLSTLHILRGLTRLPMHSVIHDQEDSVIASIVERQEYCNLRHPYLQASWLDILNTLGQLILRRTFSKPLSDVKLNQHDKDMLTSFQVCCLSSRNHAPNSTGIDTGKSLVRRLSLLNGLICSIVGFQCDLSLDKGHSIENGLSFQFDLTDFDSVLFALERIVDFVDFLMPVTKERLVLNLCSIIQDATVFMLRSTMERTLVQLLNQMTNDGTHSLSAQLQHRLQEFYYYPGTVISSPRCLESRLDLWGFCLGARWNTKSAEEIQPKDERETEAWILTTEISLGSDNELSMRYAAASSLRNFVSVMATLQGMPSPFHGKIVLLMHTLTIDDDDEIRDIGADAIVRLSASRDGNTQVTHRVVPQVAAGLLIKYIVAHLSTSNLIFRGMLSRLIGQDCSSDKEFEPVERTIIPLLERDTALFSKEKQNLYIDEVSEACQWSQTLKEMELQRDSEALLVAFSNWVLEGLDTLTAIARQNSDGPLGWTSIEGAFCLGMRVLYSAELLLHWQRHSQSIQYRITTLYRKLFDFAESGRNSDVHDLWLRKTDGILQRSISTKLSRIATGLQQVVATAP